MSAAELQSWWIYYQMSPWGDERNDIRSGMEMAVMVNLWAQKGRRARPADFIPDYFKPHIERKEQTADQMFQTLFAGTQQAGGKVIQPERQGA